MNHESILSKGVEVEVREKMKRYWQVYKPSIESMMLSHDAQYLAENEQNELLSYLPSYKGRQLLELGAGIGRFTSRFAQLAGHVTAIDFMDSYIKQNEETNGHFENITFRCDDVTKLDFPAESFDMVFSNWLLMYLANSEVEKLMQKVLRWLKPNGYFFFRESCYHQSGNLARSENPTKYRTPLDYINVLNKSATTQSKYVLKSAKNVLTYIHYHGNPNQLCLLVQKKETTKNQNLIKNGDLGLKYSNLFANNITKRSLSEISVGEHLIKNLGVKLGLRAGQRVLNVGCESGAIPTFLVKNFDVFVHGIDTSPLRIHQAIEAQGKIDLDFRKKIQYEASNWLEVDLTSEIYEVILCFDIMLTKDETLSFISKSQRWLKHGGKLAILSFFTENSSMKEGTEDFLTTAELENHLKSLSLTLQEVKSEVDLSVKYLASLLFDLKKSQPESDNKDITRLSDAITRQVDLVNKKKIKLVKIIASK